MSDHSDDDADLFCPALPPHLLEKKDSKTINKEPRIHGPSLPNNIQLSNAYVIQNEYEEENSKSENEDEDDDDEDVVGPILSAAEDDRRFNVPEMEERIQKFITKASKQNVDITERESWMLELPSEKTNLVALGLGPRQFRKKNPLEIGDRSVWTDTPEMKERKKRTKDESSTSVQIEDLACKKRDERLTDLVKQYDERKRNTPLVESHKKKKAKIEENKPKERKPFSREEDLNVNKFDEAQKETIMKKARQLNDRFSSGNKKFL